MEQIRYECCSNRRRGYRQSLKKGQGRRTDGMFWGLLRFGWCAWAAPQVGMQAAAAVPKRLVKGLWAWMRGG